MSDQGNAIIDAISRLTSALEKDMFTSDPMVGRREAQQRAVVRLALVLQSLKVAEVKHKTVSMYRLMADGKQGISKYVIPMANVAFGVTYGVLVPYGQGDFSND